MIGDLLAADNTMLHLVQLHIDLVIGALLPVPGPGSS